MQIGRNPHSISIYAGIRRAADGLYASMRKLSSGQRLERPGDGPSELGISEAFRYQIRNGGEARHNIENAQNMMNTADSWLQVTHELLSRMSELAISSRDASKARADRDNLNAEYLQLKEEVQRIAREAEYNGVQVAGRDQILSYDQDKQTFFFSQLDGDEAYHLPVKVLSGLQSQNSLDFLFDNTKDFTLSHDGKYIFYVDSNDNLTRYDIEKGVLARDTADIEDKSLEVDNEGRLWYATEDPPASTNYSLRQQDIGSWTQDTTLIGNTDITDMDVKEFKVYENRVYYYDTNGDFISRNLNNLTDVKQHLTSADITLNTTDGQFAISEDGQFVADVVSPGVVRITNAGNKQSNTYNLGATVTVDDLTFSVDNNELAFIDTTDSSIHRLSVELSGDFPKFGEAIRLHKSQGTGYIGLSLDGGSNRGRFRVQHGPDAGQESFLLAGDVRLNTLGLSRTSVADPDEAKEALARLQEAIERVSLQRSNMGVHAARLGHTMEALTRYIDNLSISDSVIRDVDVALESTSLAEHQVRQEAALAILAQANARSSTVLQLLIR